jgi:hypothetical protein
MPNRFDLVTCAQPGYPSKEPISGQILGTKSNGRISPYLPGTGSTMKARETEAD